MDVGSVLYVIGNGPGNLPPDIPGMPYVAFNQVDTVPLGAGEIRINNRKMAGLTADAPPFVVSSAYISANWCRQLQASLATAAAELETELGCLPSAGLATVYALSGLGVSLQLYRMPLRPSLLRAPDMPARQPLAAAFHNWLGERRLAWQWWQALRPTLSWPQLCLSADDGHGAGNGAAPYPVLLQWFAAHAGQPAQANTDTLQALTALPATAWYPSASAAQLKVLEGFFFLSRQQSDTANWWLYRNDLSPFIDTLLLRLMQMQQCLASVPAAG